MRILIDDYGAYLKKKGNRFVVASEGKTEEFSSDKVSQVMVLRGSAISTDAMELASAKNIDIVCLDRVGRPYARIYPCRLGGTALTRRNQLEAYRSRKGVVLAKSFVQAKIGNMGYFLRSLAKARKDVLLRDAAERILGLGSVIATVKGDIDGARNRLLGIEGECSKTYFQVLSRVLPVGFFSGARSKRPPRDLFNALLGYGYGMLYGEVERACIISGLDPYLGFLHTDRHGRPSLVLDLIEEFRQPIVDRAMVTLCVRGMVDDDCIDREDGVFLNAKGRKLAVEAMMTRLGAKIKHGAKRLSFEEVILKQARELARFVNGDRKRYTPFLYRW
jgi:CRISPR-associated protein Cas1